MHDAVLVTVTRSGHPESEHHGSYCVIENGAVVRSKGNLDVPVYFRSAAKPIQALAVVESGAADRFGFTDDELALCCGSHDGSPEHAARAASMLRKCGGSEKWLRCAGHPPLSREVADEYARRGYRPGPLEDNCSGKHAGMIAAAIAWGEDPAAYADPAHRVQRRNLENVARLAGVDESRVVVGVDGCAAPTFAVPLPAIARAAASFGSGSDAERRVFAAAVSHPEMVAGPRRFSTRLMRRADGSLLAKSGAEGVQIVCVPARRLGIAVKIADGAARAVHAVTSELLLALGLVEPADVAGFHPKDVRTRAGAPVGTTEVSL